MEDEKKLHIAVPSSIIMNGNSLAMAIYGVAQDIYKRDKGSIYASPEVFASVMDIPLPLRKGKKEEFLTAFEDLQSWDYFIKKNNQYYIDTSLFFRYNETFTLIDIDVFWKLVATPNLLFHYILIKKGLIDGVCKFSLNYFAKLEGVSLQTITRRTKELVDMELIYTYRTPYDPTNKKYGNNVYMLFDPTRNFVKEENYSNLNRKVSQRYNAFVRNPDNFTPLEIKGLRKQVEEYNTRNPERQKDLSVFNL